MATFSRVRLAWLSSTAIDEPPGIVASTAVIAKSYTADPAALAVSVIGMASAGAVSGVLFAAL
jgi:hypothetical protein